MIYAQNMNKCKQDKYTVTREENRSDMISKR